MTNVTRRLWLAADYHLPATYSCRLPFSSATSAQASPGPGPASVRLALIRTGIELFGRARVRNTFFPLVRAVPVFIRPPAAVALSSHFLHGYKVDTKQEGHPLRKSPLSREMAHAAGIGPWVKYYFTPVVVFCSSLHSARFLLIFITAAVQTQMLQCKANSAVVQSQQSQQSQLHLFWLSFPRSSVFGGTRYSGSGW